MEAIRAGTIQPHLVTTLSEVLLGLLVGVTAGFVTGFLLARSAFAERLLSPYIVAAQATPILALAPLIAMWFGSGILSKVLICALICFFPMAIATTVGLRSVDPRLMELGRSLRATRRQLVTTIEVPAAAPQIMGGVKVAVTLAVVGAIVAEWVGGDRGLGVLINLARGGLFDTPLLFATLLTIALMGVVLYLIASPHRASSGRRPSLTAVHPPATIHPNLGGLPTCPVIPSGRSFAALTLLAAVALPGACARRRSVGITGRRRVR